MNLNVPHTQPGGEVWHFCKYTSNRGLASYCWLCIDSEEELHEYYACKTGWIRGVYCPPVSGYYDICTPVSSVLKTDNCFYSSSTKKWTISENQQLEYEPIEYWKPCAQIPE